MTTIKAAAVQLSPVLYSRERTTAKVLRKILELGRKGVQYAVFSEALIPYYPYFSFVQPRYQMSAELQRLLDQAVVVPSIITEAIGEAAREAHLVVSVGVIERDGATIYNTQLLFDADGTLLQRRRKISPTFPERLVWRHGDASGLRAVDTAVGRIGQLTCWEHYNPLARYALIADGEEIHAAMYPGSFGGELFARQTEVNIRQHALEAGAFVVNATSWLSPEQQARIVRDAGGPVGPLSGGSFTAIVAPNGELLGEPLLSGEGEMIADLDFDLIAERKPKMDGHGYYNPRIGFPMSRLNGKRALVTGGSRGIGAAIALRLAQEGADVALTYEKSAARAQAVVDQIQALGRKGLAIAANSAEPAAVKVAVDSAAEALGGLDILVNSASIARGYGPVETWTLEDIDQTLAVNVRGVILAIQAAVAHLPKGGRIITIGSNLAERVPHAGITLYAASKSALLSLTRGLAHDLGPRGVTVNLVHPGSTDTDMNPATGDTADFQRSRMPIPEYGRPENIASMVAWLASEDGRFANGAGFTVDGGANA